MEKDDKQIPEHAVKDDLTGLALRKELFAHLEKLIADCSGRKGVFSLVLFDIDHFKRCNDKYGHLFGDVLLGYVADSMRLFLWGEGSEIFRYGGDEFIVVLSGKKGDDGIRSVNKFKRGMFLRPFPTKGRLKNVTISAGIAVYPHDGTGVEELIKKADEAMYYSKHHGRNLTTLAGRIKYHKLTEHFRFVVIIILTIALILLAHEYITRSALQLGGAASAIKAKLSKINSDRVVMKNGIIYNGKIVNETNTELALSIYTETGQMTTLNLNKADIEEKRYGLIAPSRQRYEDYMKKYPNPHID